jgi:hypothetical protein
MLNQSMPMKVKALHICFGSSGKNVYDVLGPVEKYLYGKELRLRLVEHRGLNAELVTSLESYGISTESLHVNVGGSYTDSQYMTWLYAENRAE